MTQPVKRIVCLAVALLFLATFAVFWQASTQKNDLKRIPIDVLITDVGRFAIDEDHFLDIERWEQGETAIRVFVQPEEGFFKSEPYLGFQTGSRFQEEWYVVADRYNRIWIYVGDSPSGRKVPSVFKYGPSVNQAGKPCRISEEVSVTGRWDGVPQVFLSRIHASSNPFAKSVPQLSPPLAQDQQIPLASAIQTRR